MSLSASEKAAVLSIVGKIGSQVGALGSEALTRYGSFILGYMLYKQIQCAISTGYLMLLLSFPQTKTYFTHFDLTPGSAQGRICHKATKARPRGGSGAGAAPLLRRLRSRPLPFGLPVKAGFHSNF
ncbi:hypothetical protein AB205_0131710 [Aquarana catesbeiana]|uniref:Uncharacterized protein n=1 Tax=Aquarana catesbeiana TaxID=8400 RepID=A0A2G9RIJ2_AQUCT|nr:hypothetical protein AB205_0131710 [Aquarana catesbeiana]